MTDRLEQLEARVAELEMMQTLLVRILSTTRPLAGVLQQYGATETQEQAVHRFLDSLVERARGPERDRPSLAYFQMHIDQLLPRLRGDREFLKILVDTLRVERPAYRELHEYIVQQAWPLASA